MSDYALCQLLSTQIKTLLNLVPYDFVDWQTRYCGENAIKKFFQPLQLLEGLSHIDLIYKKPCKLKTALNYTMDPKNWNEEDQQLLNLTGYKYLSLLERVIGHDVDRGLNLVNLGLQASWNEVSYDYHQGNSLERCFTGINSFQLMNSADMLIDHMLSFRVTDQLTVENMLVGILPYVASNID